MRFAFIGLVWLGLTVGWNVGTAPAGTGIDGNQAIASVKTEPIILHFDTNKAVFDDKDRIAMRRRLPNQWQLDANEKILVVGYTDNSGSRHRNYTLSYQRAQAVRREMITALGLAPDGVLAIGRGAENPLADNRRPEGRAQNRRVEIYPVRMSGGTFNDVQLPMDANAKRAIEDLVHKAQQALRRDQYKEALQLLQEARERGGDRLGSWHTVFGISGYYANAPARQVKAHLQTALRMDPYDQDARDYLGRVQARERVSRGLVTADMGRIEQDAIAIGSEAQAHEYLRLFKMQPLSRIELVSPPLTVWTCRDARGQSVVYYFDRTQVLAWAFALESAAGGPDSFSEDPSGQVVQHKAAPISLPSDKRRSAAEPIWNSKVFR